MSSTGESRYHRDTYLLFVQIRYFVSVAIQYVHSLDTLSIELSSQNDHLVFEWHGANNKVRAALEVPVWLDHGPTNSVYILMCLFRWKIQELDHIGCRTTICFSNQEACEDIGIGADCTACVPASRDIQTWQLLPGVFSYVIPLNSIEDSHVLKFLCACRNEIIQTIFCISISTHTVIRSAKQHFSSQCADKLSLKVVALLEPMCELKALVWLRFSTCDKDLFVELAHAPSKAFDKGVRWPLDLNFTGIRICDVQTVEFRTWLSSLRSHEVDWQYRDLNLHSTHAELVHKLTDLLQF